MLTVDAEEGIMTCRHVVEDGIEPIHLQGENPGEEAIVCKECLEASMESGQPTDEMMLTCRDCLMKRLRADLDRRKV